ncbi:MAG: ABC transporter ATP-binding protein [Clostridia bacterium]|nr:ABC transporter ATP-binding protein [Clostridia bacterium]NCC42776.1 ABC transporter ATP-binding protein [Clostridia bacterium]
MENILEIKEVSKTFYKNKIPFTAVDGISFEVRKGECLGLVGESGCGKSTAARMITRMLDADKGMILLSGQNIRDLKGRKLKEMYKEVQMIFQMPQDSFDPRRKLGDGIIESLINHGRSRREALVRLKDLMRLVELDENLADRYPHQVSGGQCQRAAIARALAIEPSLIICDEATSALDVTVQAQVIELLKKLQRKMNLSMLFICHDLALVQAMCDRVLVMYQGKIVEEGTPDEIIMHPREEYTKLLIDSVL